MCEEEKGRERFITFLGTKKRYEQEKHTVSRVSALVDASPIFTLWRTEGKGIVLFPLIF